MNTLNMVPIPYENKDMSKYSIDKLQMREDLHGHSVFDFDEHDQNQIVEAFKQQKQTSGKIKDCLFNEIYDPDGNIERF